MKKTIKIIVFLLIMSFIISCTINTSIILNNGIEKFEEKKFDESIKLLTTISDSDLSGKANFYIGWSFHSKKDLENAKKYYLKAIKQKPEYAEAYNNLGILYSDLNDYENAIDSLQKAVEFKPKFAIALSTLASMYLDLGKYEEAEPILLKAQDINNDDIFVNYNLGFLYYNKKQYDIARKYLEKYIKIYDENNGDTSVSDYDFYGTAKQLLEKIKNLTTASS